jgi:hypothetical protein
MKMKKMFKLLMCAAIVAAGFTACSEEVTPIDSNNPGGTDGPVVKGEQTNATFSFKLSGTAPSTKTVNPASFENTNVTEFRVLIFDAEDGDKLEIDTARTIANNAPLADSLLTIPLISGQKKIFVFANAGTTAAAMTSNSTPSIPAKGSITTLGDINGAYSFVTGSTGPFTDIPGMHSLYPTAAAGKFFFSSSVRDAVKGLTAGVSAADSKDPDNSNYITISLDRPVAKVAITKRATSGPDAPTNTIITQDSAGVILTMPVANNSVKYKFYTVNVAMYPFQKGTNTQIETPWYEPTAPIDPLSLNHYADALGSGSNADILVASRSGDPTAASFYYIPENNPNIKMKGNTTFAAVEAIFLPTKHHHVVLNATSTAGVNYNESQGFFTLTVSGDDLTTASDMYRYKVEGTPGLPGNTLFAGPDAVKLARKIYYHLENPSIAPKGIDDTDYSGVTDGQLLKYFVKYTGGKAYYRLDVGEESGSNQYDYTIKRNYYYDAEIIGFKQLGEADPLDLKHPENEVLKGATNLTVHIIISDWTGVKVTPII